MTGKLPLQYDLHQALGHHKAGHSRLALQGFRRILKLLPLHVDANAHLGALLLHQGQAAQAVVYLHRARQGQPKVLQHWVRLLAGLQATGDIALARALLTSAAHKLELPEADLQRLSLSLNTPPQDRQLGLVQMYRQGNHLNTEIAAYLFMEDYPAHPLGWQILGAVQYDTGQWDKALHTRTQTAADFPTDINAFNNLAQTHFALGHYAQVVTIANQGLQLDPSFKPLQNLAAQAAAANR